MSSQDKLTQSLEASRLADALRPDLDTLRNAPARLGDILKDLRAAVAQANLDAAGRLTPVGQAEVESGLRNKALQAIDTLEAQCQAAKGRIERRLAEAEQRPLADAATETLLELKRQAAWNRTRPILDRLEAPALLERIGSLAKQAAEAGDDATLRALESELPAYLEARRMTSLLLTAQNTVDQARLPHLPPAARQAVSVRRDLATGWPRLAAAFQAARREASGQGGLTIVLPGWNTAERITL